MAINSQPDLLADLEFPDKGPGYKAIQKTDKYNIVRVCIKGGVTVPTHKGDHTAFFTVLQGKGIFTLGDERFELSAGGYIFIPLDKERSIESVEDLVLLAVK